MAKVTDHVTDHGTDHVTHPRHPSDVSVCKVVCIGGMSKYVNYESLSQNTSCFILCWCRAYVGVCLCVCGYGMWIYSTPTHTPPPPQPPTPHIHIHTHITNYLALLRYLPKTTWMITSCTIIACENDAQLGDTIENPLNPSENCMYVLELLPR